MTATRAPSRPVAVGLLAVWLVVTLAPQVAGGGGDADIGALVREGVMIGIVGGALLLLVVALAGRYGPGVGLMGPSAGALRVGALPIAWVAAMLVVSLVGAGVPAMPALGFLLANSLAVGVSEELMFRGVLLGAFREAGVRRAVLGTAIAFGAVHALNAAVTGEPVTAIAQAALAVGMGIWAAALRLRTGSLLLPIALHGAWDFALFAGLAGDTPLALSLLSVAGVVVLGAWGWRSLRSLPEPA